MSTNLNASEDLFANIPRHERDQGSLQINRILIGVGGGSAAGKTTLCNLIRHQIQYDGLFQVLIISLDSFYKPVDKTKVTNIEEYDFDHPDALDFDMAYQILNDLLEGKKVKIPRYDFVNHRREEKYDEPEPCDVILFEGIFALYSEKINNLMQMKIFMHCDDDIRLCRRLVRDNKERGRTVESILKQYNQFVKPSYDQFIKSTINLADLIVNGSVNNQTTVRFIVSQLKNKAKQLDWYKLKIQQEVVLFGDELDYIEENILQDTKKNQQSQKDYSIKENLDKFEKYLIFPNMEEMKEKIKSKYKRLIKFKYNQHKLAQNKNFLKYSLQMLDRLAATKGIDYKCLTSINPNHFMEFKPNPALEEEILLFPIFCLITDHQQGLVKYMQHFKQFPTVKIILMPIFASLRCLQDAKIKYPNVIHVINCLVIGNKDHFKFNLQENYKPNKQLQPHAKKTDPFEIDFMGDAYSQFIQQHLDKHNNHLAQGEGLNKPQ